MESHMSSYLTSVFFLLTVFAIAFYVLWRFVPRHDGPWYIVYIDAWDGRDHVIKVDSYVRARHYAEWLASTDRATDHIMVTRKPFGRDPTPTTHTEVIL
jgi:hypothetical protein